MHVMDWKEVIERWQALPPEEQLRLQRQRIPLNVAESMAFEGEPVSLAMLKALHALKPVPLAIAKRLKAS